MSPHNPVAEINRVNVLLHHLISTNPHEGVPVSMLPLHVAPRRVTMVHGQYRSAEIIRAEVYHFSNGTIMDLLNGFDILPLRTTLRTGDHRQLPLLGHFHRGDEPARSNRIGSDGLFGEDMLPTLNGGLELLRSVAWGSAQQNHVDVGRNHLPVGVEAAEAVVGIDVDSLTHRVHQVRQRLAREFGRALRAYVHQKLGITQVGQGLLEFVLKYVSHTHEFYAGISRQ